MKNDTTIFALLLLVLIMAGCKTNRLTERERFERSVLKELPFIEVRNAWKIPLFVAVAMSNVSCFHVPACALQR